VKKTYEEVHSTKQDFLIVQAAVMPTSVFPAPHGKTIMPERARLHITSIETAHKIQKEDIPVSKHFA
jgi:hypothetical protein